MALDFVKANQKIFLIESLGHKHKKIKNNINKKKWVKNHITCFLKPICLSRTIKNCFYLKSKFII